MRGNERPVYEPMPRIAALQGASSRAIQDLMRRFALRSSARGVKIIGLVETFDPEAASARRATRLENLGTGERYPIFQNLGPMASACHLDGAGLVAACADICREIEHGCDLVILSKFGQLETLRSGLIDAFVSAAAHDLPILTAVSPAYQAAWQAFAGAFSLVRPDDEHVIDRWWEGVSNGPSRLEARGHEELAPPSGRGSAPPGA